MFVKAIYIVLALLTFTAVDSFHAVPIALSRRHAPVSPSPFSRNAQPSVKKVLMAASPGGKELPQLPPGKENEEGEGNGQTGELTAEVGHVMANRKLTLSFTCNICEERSSYKINRVAFMHGIVVVWCQGCKQKHLIADNLGKLDFPEFGRNLEEYMAKKGTPVRRVVMSKDGISHVEVQVPGADYPESYQPNLTEQGFDGTNLLPGPHVGGSSILPGTPPMRFGGVGAGDEVIGGDGDGHDGGGADV